MDEDAVETGMIVQIEDDLVDILRMTGTLSDLEAALVVHIVKGIVVWILATMTVEMTGEMSTEIEEKTTGTIEADMSETFHVGTFHLGQIRVILPMAARLRLSWAYLLLSDHEM